MHIHYIRGFNSAAKYSMFGPQILTQTSNFTGNHTFKKNKVHSHFILNVGCLPYAIIAVLLHIFLERSYLFKLKGIQVQNMYQDPVANTFNSILNH